MLPLVEIVLFCVCIGNDPFGLHLAVINQDRGPLGAAFLQAIDSHTIVQVIKDARSISLYPYYRPQILQYVKYTK